MSLHLVLSFLSDEHDDDGNDDEDGSGIETK
ncbi:hypothetical protein ZOSMA_30G00160 [Zostera marina]|uniref:Uncharacterized protein n=1 Tax=Zostera marina TaxID=29655 RepID=A0A0K9PC10_ZOSMR|nr:hypothetical protein ZOSMA_30G00160 [Zostera marina]